MTCRACYVLALTSLALAACAAPTAPTAWNLPTENNMPQPNLLTRAEEKANPPHPYAYYPNFEDEPTRFIFRPRNVVTEEDAGNGDNGDYGDYGDYGDFGDMGGEGF
jgi:hypothetical protein